MIFRKSLSSLTSLVFPSSNLVVANFHPRGKLRSKFSRQARQTFQNEKSDAIMSKQKALASFLQQNQVSEFERDDLFVNISLYHVPASLVREFAVRIAVHYPGGIGEAIQELMKNAIK
jgi:hypothetical protein